MAEVQNGVLYVEPNYNEESEKRIGTRFYQKNLEDYCIYVDLEVEVYDRKIEAGVKGANTTFLLSWVTHSDGRTSASFHQGKRTKYGQDMTQTFNVLSTDYTNTFYEDIFLDNTTEQSNNTELFGIESINISYKNYTVPQVEIKFTDIKGTSLFAPEELRHHKTRNGVGGFSDKDIAGSFFKCFFTMPYPKFTLYVKGFYGQPVSYELCCSGFKANFNSKTGNFGATANFVGYAFSVLNDITLDAIIAAPLDSYIGKKYWENTILPNQKYWLTDSNSNLVPPITFNEFITKMNVIKLNSNSLKVENKDVYDKQGFVNNAIDELKKLKIIFSDCFHKIITFFLEKDSSRLISDNVKCICFFCSEKDNVDESLNFKDVNEYLNNLHNGCYSDYFNSISEIKTNIHKINNIITDNGSINNTESEIENSSIFQQMSEYIAKDNASFDKKTNKDCLYFDGSLFLTQCETALQNMQKIKEETDKEIGEIQTQAMTDVLKFKPSVKNFMKITMSHFETLLKIIYTASSEVEKNNASPTNKRKLSDLGIVDKKYSGVKLIEDEIVPPWPKITVKRSDNDETLVDGWIGDFPVNGIMQPEAQVIEGLLSGIINFSQTCNQSQEIIEQIAKETNEIKDSTYISNVALPLTATDLIFSGNPFGTDTITENEEHVIDDILSRAFMRAINVVFPHISLKHESGHYGILDAINFYKKYEKQLSKNTKDKIKGIDTKEILSHMTEDIDGENDKHTPFWRYNEDKYKENEPLFNYLPNNGKRFYRKYDEFPIVNETINNAINNNNKKNLNYSTKEIDFANSVFFLESSEFKKFDNISVLDSQMQIGEKDYTSKYKSLVRDNLLKNFKYDEKNVFENGSTRTFTNDYDGIFSKEYLDEFSFSYKRKLKSSNDYKDYSLEDVEEAKWNGCGIIDNTNKNNYNLFPLNNKKIEDVDGLYVNDVFSVEKMIDHGGMGENSITQTFTIPHVQFYNTKTSLFLTDAYYVSSLEEKAFLFLDNMRNHDVGNVINEIIKSLERSDDKECVYTTKIGVLLLGAYIYRYENYDSFLSNAKNTLDGAKLKEAKQTQRLWSNKDLGDSVFWSVSHVNDARLNHLKQIKYKFKEYFLNWVKSYYQQIDNALSLNFDYEKSKNNYFNTLKNNISKDEFNFKKDGYNLIFNGKEEYYSRILDNGILLFRQDSELIKQLTKLYTQPLLVVIPHYFTTKSDYSIDYNKEKIKVYLNNFINSLKELVSSEISETNDTVGSLVNPTRTSVNIKISLYKYVKILYDKWISGTDFDNWTVDNFFNKHFHFVDTFYYDIGDKAQINPQIWFDYLLQSQQNMDLGFIDFLSSVLAKNNLSFIATNNFFDLNTSNNFIERMNEMFEPIAYLDMIKPSPKQHFVVLFKGETSSKLDIDGHAFVNDSFMLNYDKQETWPKAITSKNDNNGFPIPAFGVSYGDQYQSYFTDISVNLDSPIATDQSLQAEFNIASMNGSNTENAEKTYCVGQDLYTVYANNSYTCNITMMGCAWVQPLMYFVLNNIPLFRGSYLIEKVTHSITPGNMVTNFMGVRMANTLTPFVKEAILSDMDDGFYGGSSQNSLSIASENSCEFNAYNVISVNGGCTEETLQQSYDKYGYSVQDDDKNPNRYNTILDALAQTVKNEAGDNDELQMKLVATVLFNRWCKHGRNFKQLFKVGQVAYNKDITDSQKAKPIHYKVIRDIFINTPIVLVGQKTNVINPVTIYNHGVKDTSRKTESCKLTLDMLQKMYMYCTPTGYDESNTSPQIRPTNSKGLPYLEKNPQNWRKQMYLCHHDTNKIYGHVFTTGDGDKTYWEVKDDTTDGVGENGLSDIANGLVSAVQKTIDNSNVVKYKVESKVIDKNSPNLFIINSSKKEQSYLTFDIILNTYGDYCKTLYWVVNEENASSQEYPNSILVEVKEKHDANGTDIRIATSESLNSSTITMTKDSVNSKFYKILSKKYNGGKDINSFKSDCRGQFGNQTDDEILLLLSANVCDPCYLRNIPSNVKNGQQPIYNLPDASNETWAKSVETMGMWYANNVQTYLNAPNNKMATGTRKTYFCPLINGKVGDDCSSFVSACLEYAGYKGFWHDGGGLCAKDFLPNGIGGKKLQEYGFIPHTNIDNYTSVKPFYISAYAKHVEITAGKDYVNPWKGNKGVFKTWGWGNQHYHNMPSKVDIKQHYDVYWQPPSK